MIPSVDHEPSLLWLKWCQQQLWGKCGGQIFHCKVILALVLYGCTPSVFHALPASAFGTQ